MKCIRCYKAYHLEIKPSEITDLDNEDPEKIQAMSKVENKTNCFSLKDMLPISGQKFICRDHLEIDNAKLESQQALLGFNHLLSLNNQMKVAERSPH